MSAATTAVAVAGAKQYLAPVTTDVSPEASTPYVTFAFPIADKYGEMAAAIPGLQTANPVLFLNNQYRKLDPFRFHLVRATPQIWVERNQGREALAVKVAAPARDEKQYVEEIYTSLLVYTPSGLVAATATFKKAATSGIKTVIGEFNLVNDAKGISDWIGRSPDHKAASAIPYPFGRFTANLKSFMKPPKGPGKPYHMTQATTLPTTAADAAAIAKFFTDEASVSSLNAVVAFTQSRYDDLVKLAK